MPGCPPPGCGICYQGFSAPLWNKSCKRLVARPTWSTNIKPRLSANFFTVNAHHKYTQWRTQKIFMGGVSFSGRWWPFVFGVRCLWRHNLASYSCFQAKFVDIIGIFFCTHSLYFCKKTSPIHSPYNQVFVK